MWRRRGPNSIASPSRDGPDADADLQVVLQAMVNRRAFAPLYEKYLTSVYRRCLGRLRDPDEAWDATSVTFHKALTALEGFQGGSFASWLNRIADNACTDVHRDRTRHPQVPFDTDLDWADDGPDPEDEVVAAMDREELERALRRLPARREQVVRLRLAGLTGKEIAGRLGVSHDVVRQQQRQALVQLAGLLGVDDDHAGREVRNG